MAMTNEATDWIEARGIDNELATAMGIVGMRGKSGKLGVVLPYRKGGELLGRKYRLLDGDQRFTADKGWTRDLWNVDCLYDATLSDCPVVITEGEFDALACIQAGSVRSVSIPDGWTEGLETVNGGAKMEPLIRNETALRNSPHVVIAADNDPVGHSFLKAVSNLLDGHDVRWTRWPDGCKDANDVLREHGEGSLAKCLQEAKPVNPAGSIITGVSDIPPRPKRMLLKSGVPAVDRISTFEVGAISVLTGVPGMGKSTFATWLAHRIVKNHDVRCALLMMESHPERVRKQLACLETGSAFPKDIDFVHEKLDRNWRIVQLDETFDDAFELGWLRGVIHTLAVRDQCKLIVIDPWNEIEHFPAQGESLTNYINAALTMIRKWAAKFDCHIMIVAHPKKMQDDKPPLGYDIADSAAFMNKPAMGMTIHQTETEFQVIAWKVRDAEAYGCQRGRIRMEFDPGKLCYREMLGG
jgi:twinkle protein